MEDKREEAPNTQEQEWSIAAFQELRLEINHIKTIVVLLEGTAEVFGTELCKYQEYPFVHQRIAIFSYGGCKILVIGKPELAYMSTHKTNMHKYCRLHKHLNDQRQMAKDDGSFGPRVLVCGPQDSGKSTLCRLLVNYAVRSGWYPTFVDLDVSQNAICVPGSVAATPVYFPFEVNEGLVVKQELSLFYGHVVPSKALAFYLSQCHHLATFVHARQDLHREEKAAGCIIDTCATPTTSDQETSLETLMELIARFHVDLCIVMGDERLAHKLTSRFVKKEQPHPKVIYFHKPNGVVPRDREQRRALEQQSFYRYFYGSDVHCERVLCCQAQILDFNDVGCFRVTTQDDTAPKSVLPLGTESLLDPKRLQAVEWNSENILHSIVAVTFAERSLQMAEEPIAGFAYVLEQDTNTQQVTLVMPAVELPSPNLLLGSLKWIPD